MALYALDALDDAFAATRAFLTPVDRGVWIRLAVVVLFVGSPGGSLTSLRLPGGDGGEVGGSLTAPASELSGIDLGARAWLLIAAAVVGLLLVGLTVALVGSVMEFVLVESLRREEVEIRRYWRRRWRQGLRLFGFRVVIGLIALGSVAALAAAFFLAVFGVGAAAVALLAVVLFPVAATLVLVVGLVNGFTTVFVVPIMIRNDCGVLAGWRRLWSTITREPKQYLVYAVAGVVLSALGGFLVVAVTAVLGVVLLLPFGLAFAVGAGVFAFVAEPVGIVILAAAGLLFGLTLLAVGALVRVPVATYLRYYALLVLGDVDRALDLIPELRASVRETSAE